MNLEQIKAEIEWLRNPPPKALTSEVNERNQKVVVALCDKMVTELENNEWQHMGFYGFVLESVRSLEEKVGTDYSSDRDSLDFRVRKLERQVNRMPPSWPL